MDDLRLDRPRELRVDHLVGVAAKPRVALDAAQEVDAPLPPAVEEDALVDQRHPGPQVTRRLGGGVLGRSGAQVAVGRSSIGDVTTGRRAQRHELLGLIAVAVLADELAVRAVVDGRSFPRRRSTALSCSCDKRGQARKFVRSVAERTVPPESVKRSMREERSRASVRPDAGARRSCRSSVPGP